MHTPSSENTSSNRVLIDAGSGALAGCISRFVVGPLDVIKIRFQVQLEPIRAHPDAPAAKYFMQSKYTSFRQAFVTIVKEEGIRVPISRSADACILK
jgi:solute carrier family 25 (mitochondrial thiamine pyrophosphate transporter), member 19